MTEAYKLGQEAFLDGTQCCPYIPNTECHLEWLRGWQEQWQMFLHERGWENI